MRLTGHRASRQLYPADKLECIQWQLVRWEQLECGRAEPEYSGRLTIAGNLTFFGIAPVMQCNVVPASADNVYVSGGTGSLTGRLKVKMTGTFMLGTRYTLLHADVRNGTFSSTSIIYPTNQCFTPVITYDANNVYLYLEPTC